MRFLLIFLAVWLMASPAFAEWCIPLEHVVDMTPDVQRQITQMHLAAYARQFIPQSAIGLLAFVTLFSIGLFLQNMLRLKPIKEPLTTSIACILSGLLFAIIKVAWLFGNYCRFDWEGQNLDDLSIFGYLHAYPGLLLTVGVSLLLWEITRRYRENRSLKQAGQ